MCRMCLVDVEGPRGATLTPACFVAVTDGMVVDSANDRVKKAQDGVLEFLLANHPLDCPVCDKGGECPLQDQTLAYGPGESRFIEEKRHFEKPIAISDLVLLDRERCIQCARCTRFAAEVAGEAQIDFAGRGEGVEVATFPTEPFSSYFSGNTVQICPVGALTATPYRFTARPWDLDQVESTCTACSVGCRVAVQSSQNRLTRLLGIDSEPVNHGWLCDKGRFAYESVNGDEVDAGPLPTELADEAVDVAPATASQVVSLGVSRGQFLGEAHETGRFEHGRLVEPRIRKEGELVPVSWGEALAAAAAGIAAAKEAGGSGAVALIGGARLTNESAYAWAKLAKGVVGTDSVDAQLGDGLPADLVLGLPRATIDEACQAPVLVTLAGDLREELPVLFLRLREAVSPAADRAGRGQPDPHRAHPAGGGEPAHPPGRRAAAGPGADGRRGGGDRARHPPRGRGGRARRARDGPPPARGAPRRRGRGDRGRPTLLRRVGRGGRRGGAQPGRRPAQGHVPAGAAPGQRVRGPRHGAGPGPPAGPGQPRCGPRALHRRLGLRARRRRARRPPTSSPPWRASATTTGDGDRVRALVLLGADPLSDFPDRAVAEKALSAGHFVVAVTGPPVGVGRRARRRRAAVRRVPRAARHDDQHRGPGEPPRAEDLGAGVRLAGLDDRGRAGRRPRGRPGRAERRRPRRGAGAGRTGLRRADPGGPALRRRPRRHPRAAGPRHRPPRRRGADRPDRPARRRVGGAPGGAAPRRHRHRRARRGAPRRARAARRPCSPGPGPAAPSRCTSPRPTTTRCAWWPAAACTTPAAR